MSKGKPWNEAEETTLTQNLEVAKTIESLHTMHNANVGYDRTEAALKSRTNILRRRGVIKVRFDMNRSFNDIERETLLGFMAEKHMPVGEILTNDDEITRLGIYFCRTSRHH